MCITAVNALLALFALFADQGLGPRQMHLTDIASHYFRDTVALPDRAARAGTGRLIAFGLPVMWVMITNGIHARRTVHGVNGGPPSTSAA